MLSVATTQRLSGAVEGLLHPALLATLVYRFGRPGGSTRSPSRAMANGQCCLVRRDLLHQLGGFSVVRDSLCEDVTLARLAACSGDAVGFFEAEGLVEVAMYADWREAWRNWPRSLATRDALSGVAGWLGLLEVLLVQALPLPLLLTRWPVGAPRRLNLLLLAVRAGMLVGMARAYPSRPWTYWLSPLLDLPAALALWRSALRRRHTWRGRTYAAPERTDCRRMRLARALLRRTCRRARLRSGRHADRAAPSGAVVGQPARSASLRVRDAVRRTAAYGAGCRGDARVRQRRRSAGAARCCFSHWRADCRSPPS